MSIVVLADPTKQYAEQVMAYRKEMLQNKDRFDGCAGLEEVHSFEEWIDFGALGIGLSIRTSKRVFCSFVLHCSNCPSRLRLSVMVYE